MCKRASGTSTASRSTGSCSRTFSDSLRQQGPDGESCYVDNSIALLYRPFHTTAESRREKQPYLSHRGFVLTWDGRLDNREVLIADLRSDLECQPNRRRHLRCRLRSLGDRLFPPHRRRLGCLDLEAGTTRTPVRRRLHGHPTHFLLPQETIESGGRRISARWCFFRAIGSTSTTTTSPDTLPTILIAHLTPYREIREVPPGQFLSDSKWQTSQSSASGDSAPSREFATRPMRNTKSTSAICSGNQCGAGCVQTRRSSPNSAAGSTLPRSSAWPTTSLQTKDRHVPRLDTISYYDNTEPNGDDSIYFPKIEQKRGRVGIHIDGSRVGSFSGFA